jgi:hypothetical protein
MSYKLGADQTGHFGVSPTWHRGEPLRRSRNVKGGTAAPTIGQIKRLIGINQLTAALIRAARAKCKTDVASLYNLPDG